MKTLDRWTTVFAAIAGFSSAVAAFQAYSQQRSTALNEIRPIIMFENWEYDEYADSKTEGTFRVRSIKNLGSGPALLVSGELKPQSRSRTDAFLFYTFIAVLGPSEAKTIDWEGRFPWKDSMQSGLSKQVNLELTVYCVDLESNRYETTFRFLAHAHPPHLRGVVSSEPQPRRPSSNWQELAPGLELTGYSNLMKSKEVLWIERSLWGCFKSILGIDFFRGLVPG